MFQYLVKFIETANLDFNLQVEALLLQISMATVDSIVDATGEIDMVIFKRIISKDRYGGSYHHQSSQPASPTCEDLELSYGYQGYESLYPQDALHT